MTPSASMKAIGRPAADEMRDASRSNIPPISALFAYAAAFERSAAMEWTSFNACRADKLHPPTTSLHRKVARLQRLMDLRAIGAPLGRREQTVGATIGEPAQWAGGE
jgi:hypothetical protein